MKIPFSAIAKPEYIFRPGKLCRRILSSAGLTKRNSSIPGGLQIKTFENDEISKAINLNGIYDLCLTEALWRLTKRGAICIDAGANIGYASCIMAGRSGRQGKVTAFEPHPGIYKKLSENAESWNNSKTSAHITCIEKGLSDYSGSRCLNIPPLFSSNMGMAHFFEEGEKPYDSAGVLDVPCITLDKFVETEKPGFIDVLKIDTEGHELNVIKGAERLLREKLVHILIFEDSRSSYLTPKDLYQDYTYLFKLGYSVLRLKRSLFGPAFDDMKEIKDDNKNYWKSWEPPTFIATPDLKSTAAMLKKKGWYCLLNKDFKG